jgi:hypothetical protein
VFSRASSQDETSRAKIGALWVQERTIAAKEQLTPLVQSALLNANRGVYQARVWAAPRVELAGVAVQERIAPAVSSAIVSTAHRMQPVEPQARRRWPVILAGVVTVSAGCVAAVLLRGQRAARFDADVAPAPPPPPAPPEGGTTGSTEQSDTAQADVNGQVRTPGATEPRVAGRPPAAQPVVTWRPGTDSESELISGLSVVTPVSGIPFSKLVRSASGLPGVSVIGMPSRCPDSSVAYSTTFPVKCMDEPLV